MHDRDSRQRPPGGLDFGDCLAYATARPADEPLLFTGDEFISPDVTVARY